MYWKIDSPCTVFFIVNGMMLTTAFLVNVVTPESHYCYQHWHVTWWHYAIHNKKLHYFDYHPGAELTFVLLLKATYPIKLYAPSCYLLVKNGFSVVRESLARLRWLPKWHCLSGIGKATRKWVVNVTPHWKGSYFKTVSSGLVFWWKCLHSVHSSAQC